MVITAFVAAVAQILLKSSAGDEELKGLKEYLNFRVIGAYALLCSTIIVNALAMRWLSYKWSVIINSSAYIFVLILSKWKFGESLGRVKLIGMGLILAGIVVFTL